MENSSKKKCQNSFLHHLIDWPWVSQNRVSPNNSKYRLSITSNLMEPDKVALG